MNINLLQGESKFVEYKREYTKTLLKTVSAFSNYHDGYIVIGVNDDGKIIGVRDLEEVRLSIENAINDSIEPKPFFEIMFDSIKDQNIVVLKVYKGDYTPYTVNQKAYKRMDTSSVQVDKHGYEELILQGRNMSYEELPCEQQNLEFSLLDSKLKHELNIHEVSQDLLVTLNLKASGRYNIAAGLLSDDNPMVSSDVQLIAYSNSSVIEIKDRQTLSQCSILRQYDICMDFYRKHVNVREIIDGAYRKTIEEIPLVAYREAVANAILHRDYSRNSDVRVEIFSDRIELLSPGGLPIGISEDEYYDGRILIPRNRILADIFFRLKIIEKLATGIRRIKEYYKEYDIKPQFKVSENSILVILPKVVLEQKVRERTGNYRLDRLSEKERLLCEALSREGIMKRSEIEKELNLKKSQTIDIINRLRSMNYIAQIGNGRATRYIIK